MEAFRQINQIWLKTINLAAIRKQLDFDRYADPIWDLYTRPVEKLVFDGAGVAIAPTFDLPDGMLPINVNKPHQLRSVFLPYLHHKNPVRTQADDRKPKVPPELEVALADPAYIQQEEARHYLQALMPMIQAGQIAPPQDIGQVMAIGQQLAQAQMIPPFDPRTLFINQQADAKQEMGKLLLGGYLNYTPNELNLKQESYDALTDGLLAGRGVLWTEALETTRGTMVGSFHVPIRDFFVDPDHSKPRDWQFIVRKHRKPKWLVAQEFAEYGLKETDLVADGKSTMEASKEAIATHRARYNVPVEEDKSRAQDLVTYYEILSRCGLGQHFVQDNDTLRAIAEKAGHCVRLVVSEANEFPLNLRPELLATPDPVVNQQNLTLGLEALKWPVETYRDPAWPWPCAILDFHSQSGSPWPFAHLRGILDKLNMLNWIYSHVADSVKKSGGGRWLVNQSLDEDVKRQLRSPERELWIPVKLRPDQRIGDLATFVEAPSLNKDLWQVAMMMDTQIQEDTGMSSLLMTGNTDTQWRSSAEAQIKERKSESRPEAMADTYDDFQSRVARNEAIAARTKIDPGTISKYFGEDVPEPQAAPVEGAPPQPAAPQGRYTGYWETCVYNPDIDKVLAETDYRIEAGSMRKPNHQEMQRTVVEMGQVYTPFFVQQAQAGNPRNLQIMLDAASKAGHLPQFDASMPPPPMPAPGAEQGPPEKKEKAA